MLVVFEKCVAETLIGPHRLLDNYENERRHQKRQATFAGQPTCPGSI